MAYDRSVVRPSPSAQVYYIGHATVRVDLAGVRLLTDPLLRSRVLHLRRSAKIPADAVRGVDAVLISHLHYDHLDFPSLQRLGREMPVVAPRGAGALIRRKGAATNVIELREGEEIQIGSVTVRATHADHDTGRLPFGVRAEPVGYMIEGDGRSVYFAGDTDVFDGMSALAPVDVALLPIWGWGPSIGPGPHGLPARGPGGGTPRRPGSRSRSTGAPTIRSTSGCRDPPPSWTTPAALFEQEVLEQAPGTAVRVLRPGEATPM